MLGGRGSPLAAQLRRQIGAAGHLELLEVAEVLDPPALPFAILDVVEGRRACVGRPARGPSVRMERRLSRSGPIESLLYQGQQAELPVGGREWLLAVVGAVIARPPPASSRKVPVRERRLLLEEQLLASGLAYGTGAADAAVELAADASPGARAFAQLVAGLVRVCARAGSISGAAFFVAGESVLPHDEAVRARRAQIIALLGALAGEARAAAPLFADPLGAPPALVQRLAAKVAVRLSRRYLSESGPFAGLPLHNGLCAIEVRACVTLALASFDRARLSPAAAHLAAQAALGWRAVLVELLAGLAQAQENGALSRRGFDQVIRSQRLPAREARLLRRRLDSPQPAEQLARGLSGEALRRFALEQVLLAALVDGHFDRGALAFVERFASALGVDAGRLALVEAQVADFYRQHGAALGALRRAEIAEGLSHALTTRVQGAVLDNLDRLLQEIRETGELAELLARAAKGSSLSPAEKAKVREQLIDLAKTIPALAIFAAPGGVLLLPILIKLLPFNLLPSSFVDTPARGPLPALPAARPTPSDPPVPTPKRV